MNSVSQLFKKVLWMGSVLIAVIAIVGSLIGYFGFGEPGLLSAIIGAGMAALFVSFTAISVWLGSKLSLAGFFGVVLGGWLVKMISFLILVVLLRKSEFIVGSVLFFTLVAAVIGSLAVDAWVFTRSRIPVVAPK